MSNVKINGDKATEQISATSSYPIKQDKDDTAFGTFQRKVADKSVFKRVVGAATGVVGAGGVTSGVAAVVGALAGLVGAASAPFVLVGMGALCIAAIIGGIVFFVKNSKENIYIKELNKLLQSDGVKNKIENRKQAISYLNEMISKYKEGSVEYNAAVRFLNKNAEFFKNCLGSGNDGLKIKTVELLNNMLVGSDEGLKRKSREILKSDVLNTKGMLNIFLKNGGSVNKDAISLLKPMCKDEEIKSILSGLIGKDLVQELERQENDIKSADVVNVLYENVVKGIFSEDNKKYIKSFFKEDDGLHEPCIKFNEKGQIIEAKKGEKLKKFFKENGLNLKALKEQSTLDFDRDLKSITVNGKVTEVDRSNAVGNEKILENAFKNAEIDEETQKLIYKFPGQSTYDTSSFLLGDGTQQHLEDYTLICENTQGSKLNSCDITVNTGGSVEVKIRRISTINAIITSRKSPLRLPMAIEEVHTFKINKGENTYKTTDAKITVYKLESTDIQLTEGKTHIQLTEENLKHREMLSQVSYNEDEDNNKKDKKV